MESNDTTGAFHYRDGVYFRRLDDPDGCVEITIPPSVASGVIRIDAASWPSIVAAMSPNGETSETYAAACRLHASLWLARHYEKE